MKTAEISSVDDAARSLGKNTLSLISRILEKHDKAVLEVCFEMQQKIDLLSAERATLCRKLLEIANMQPPLLDRRASSYQEGYEDGYIKALDEIKEILNAD